MTRLTAVIISMVMAMSPGLTPAQTKAPLPAALEGPVSSLTALISDGYAEEFKEARTWHAVDLDSHGPRGAIVLFTLEGEAKTNHYGFYMAVFEGVELIDPSPHEPARYRLIAFAQVGGKGWRHVDFDHVRYARGRIELAVQGYAKRDPMCCPSKRGRVVYALRGGTLTEITHSPKSAPQP